MTKDQIHSFISNYLSKQAEEGAAHEAGETPSAEMLEHAMGVGGAEQPHGDGPGGMDIEQLLSQLSPEELQELIAQLTQGGQPGAGGEDVAGLSQGIEQSLAQNPEAQVPGAPPEKMAALNFVKSAHYIEGFIKQAMDYGLDVNQAVGMYDNALTTTVDAMKKEAGVKEVYEGTKKYITGKGKQIGDYAAGKGKQIGDYVREKAEPYRRSAASSAAAAMEHLHENKGAYGTAAGLAAGGAAGYLAGKSSDKEKKAAYLDGMFKQALAYGFSEAEAYEIVKEAGVKEVYEGAKKSITAKGKQIGDYVTGKGKQLGDYTRGKRKEFGDYVTGKGKDLKSKAEGAWNRGVNKAYTNPGKTLAAAGGAVAAAGGAGYLAGKSSNKEKKAAFLEGVFKQAMAYGFSEEEAVQFAQQAEANL